VTVLARWKVAHGVGKLTSHSTQSLQQAVILLIRESIIFVVIIEDEVGNQNLTHCFLLAATTNTTWTDIFCINIVTPLVFDIQLGIETMVI